MVVVCLIRRMSNVLRVRSVLLMSICLAGSSLSAQDSSSEASEADQVAISSPGPALPVAPLDGCAWLGHEGIRVAWLGFKQLDDAMVSHLRSARVNTVFLKHGFHDLLKLETLRDVNGTLTVETRPATMQRLVDSTQRAAAAGIHVFWLANYELEQMLPHLQRLGYQSAVAEGPARYLRPGPHEDAAPLDPVFWRGITGLHGEIVAEMSTEYPIAGVIYDIEHYAGGIMYLQNSGYSDETFGRYLKSRTLSQSTADIPSGTRYEFLKNSGRLPDYHNFLKEEAYRQGRDLARRWHQINPHLITGIWPLLDNWYSEGFLRGLSGAVPSLGLSGVEYYHGADQTESMAEYFQTRNANMLYMAGFYPPYAYSVNELEQHVNLAVRSTKNYWMLGPAAELAQPAYQQALRNAAASVASLKQDAAPIRLHYQVEDREDGPMLIVKTDPVPEGDAPTLSLRSVFGGAALCEDAVMTATADRVFQAEVPLRRRITNNRFLPRSFRSGADYQFTPVPREYQYEDPHHTKLIDGRAYGFFGTSVAWAKSVDRAGVRFDLHRPYQIVRVELAQPAKMEDRTGGPAEMTLQLGEQPDSAERTYAFQPHFAVSGRDYSEPDNPKKKPYDPRHGRAWLSWRVEVPQTRSRWLTIDLQRTRPNSSLSLGEVVITADWDGELEADVRQNRQRLRVEGGRRWTVPPQQSHQSSVTSDSVTAAVIPVVATAQQAASKQEEEYRPPIPRTFKDVAYGPHPRNLMDVWLAESDKPTPVLISIHGGAFRRGVRKVSNVLLRDCLAAGISVVTITYRFAPADIAPAQFEDAARALQFVRHNSEKWNLDPQRIASTGGSAGAGLSLWLGFHDDMADPDSPDPVERQSTRLTCMAVDQGQSSYDLRFIRDLVPELDTWKCGPLERLFDIDADELDHLPAEKYALMEEVSALPHLTADDTSPVMLTYVSALDTPVTDRSIGIHHARFGYALKEAMDELGLSCEVHAGIPKGNPQRSKLMSAFIRKHLLKQTEPAVAE